MFTEYIAKVGDRWDSIAQKAYGDPTKMGLIIKANWRLPVYDIIPDGTRLLIPITTAPATDKALLPPWKQNLNSDEAPTPVYNVTITTGLGSGYVKIYKPDGVTLYAIVPAGSIFVIPVSNNIMIKKYKSDAATIQVAGEPLQRKFIHFIGYAIGDLLMAITGVGIVGDLDDLSEASKLLTDWDSTTGIATFAPDGPAADAMIAIVGQKSI